MSRAFVRESDVEQLPMLPAQAVSLPAGAKNYLTAEGAKRLRAELDYLLTTVRPPLASPAPDDVDAKRELQAVDRRVRYVQSGLQSAEIVDPKAGPTDVVRFGATVTVREANGADSQYRIVGVDEADAERDWISWVSPLARVLMNTRVGEKTTLRTPSGTRELEVRAIAYDA